ncbi:MAG: hypothetical protein R6X12_08970 [bacterium]
MKTHSIVVLSVLLLLAAPAAATIWPVVPNTAVQPLGNNWGNYQNYGSSAGSGYFHNGIDIITPGRSNATVVAVGHGWVKGWGTIQQDLHWRLAISDSPVSWAGRAPGWLYAHIDPDRPHKSVGDEVFPGDTIGYLVYWPVEGFDHIHFARISDTGAYWNRFPDYTWWFIENPLLQLEPSGDLEPPVFENARTGQRFAFCRDNVNNSYLPPDSLVGAVDIIARVYDKSGYTTGDTTWDKLAPFRIEHAIRRADGAVVRPWTLSVEFSNSLLASDVGVIYKYDNTCRSRGDYDRRAYFFIVTNTDGDSVIESSDVSGNWNTAEVGDTTYWVLVRAADHTGNTTVDSMSVRTRNGVGVAEMPFALAAPLRAASNPGRGPVRLGFGLTRPAEVSLRVVDAAGRVVARPAAGRLAGGGHEWTLGAFPAGVFFAELELDRSERYRLKLVVTR